MMMDILHLSPEQIDEIELSELPIIVFYCFKTYVNRSDFTLSRMFQKQEGKSGGQRIDWTGLNPAHQELEKQKRFRRVIPKKFLDGLKKNVG